MKSIVGILLLMLSSELFAAGYTGWAVPTQLEYVNGGILVTGEFGDVNGCGQQNYIFIAPSSEPKDFTTMTSIILAAFVAQKEVRFYANGCTAVTFHFSGTPINSAHTSGFYIR